MLRFKIALVGVVFLLLLGACTHLPQIAGTWQGQPAPFYTRGANIAIGKNTQSLVTNQVTFTPTAENAADGTITLDGEVLLQEELPCCEGIIEPYQLNVSATASVTGKYHFDDDDEVIVILNMNSLDVIVDPDAVVYSEDMVTTKQLPNIDSLRPALAVKYQQRLVSAFKSDYARIQKINDINISDQGDILSCEIGDRDYTLRRVK